MSSIIYPIAASWVIGNGWLQRMGFHDASGAGYIHLLGGVCGLVGTAILEPRYGIFDKQTMFKTWKQTNLEKSKILIDNNLSAAPTHSAKTMMT